MPGSVRNEAPAPEPDRIDFPESVLPAADIDRAGMQGNLYLIQNSAPVQGLRLFRHDIRHVHSQGVRQWSKAETQGFTEGDTPAFRVVCMQLDPFLLQNQADRILDFVALKFVQVSQAIAGHDHSGHVRPQGDRIRAQPVLRRGRVL